MPSYAARERPERLTARLFEFSAVDRTLIKRLVGHTLARVEGELILETLQHSDGNRTRSADILGIAHSLAADRSRSYRDRGEGVPEPATSRRNIRPNQGLRVSWH